MIRLLADENFQGPIVRGVLVAKPNADIIRVQDTEMLGASDPDLLAWATSQSRILLTHDVNTMPGFAYARIKAGLPTPGVFVVNRDAPIGKVIEDIVLLIECSAAEEWENQVQWITDSLFCPHPNPSPSGRGVRKAAFSPFSLREKGPGDEGCIQNCDLLRLHFCLCRVYFTATFNAQLPPDVGR